MNKLLNSKWTSKQKLYGWKHFQVRNVLKQKKQLEMFAVCDRKISFIIDADEIKDKGKWISGWEEILDKDWNYSFCFIIPSSFVRFKYDLYG